MKSTLLILIFSSLIFGTSFSQKEENRSKEKNNTHVNKVEPPNNLSSTPNKTKIRAQKKEAVSNNGENSETEQSSSKTNEQTEVSDETILKNTVIHKEIENGQVTLYVPNMNDNLSQTNAGDYAARIKNHFDVVSEIKFYEKENYFKVNISDIEITSKTDLLNKLLSQFSIQNYTITQ